MVNSKIQIIMAKFFLRSTQAKGNANLYVKLCRPKLGVQWMVNTEIEVDVKEWTKAQSGTKNLSKYYATEQGRKVQESMNLVEGIIKNFFNGMKSVNDKSKNLLLDKIRRVVRLDAIKAEEELQQRELDAKMAKTKEEKDRLFQVWNYYDYFLNGLKVGTIRHGKRKYTDSSISAWTTFGNHLNGFLEEIHKLSMTFEDIDCKTAIAFISHLENKGLMAATVCQQINHFRKLCNQAAEEGVNTNATSLRIWHSSEAEDDEKRAEIILSEYEIDALYSMKLDGILEQVRDIWCLGFFSSQRVSDYSKLSKENFRQTPSGLKVIVLKQQKTGKNLMVPILDERVFELCEKYDYKFPMLTRDTQNRFIKIVARELSESVPSLKEWCKTMIGLRERQKEESYKSMRKRVEEGEILRGEEAKRYKKMKEYADEHNSGEYLYKRDFAGNIIRQKWELITCHTSRRSAITAMYDSGIYDLKDIMSVSGHQTLKNVERYLKRDTITQAERLAEKARNAKVVKLKKEA